MSELSIISNILFSKNPFLVCKLHEYVGEHNKDKIRKTIINVKYWYSCMPEECKSIFLKIIENKVFTIHNGVYVSEFIGDMRKYQDIVFGSSIQKKTNVANSFSVAVESSKNKVPETQSGMEFTLVDNVNNFVFKSTTQELLLINKYGVKLLALTTCEQHSLLVYSAIRGLGIMAKNIAAIEKVIQEESLKTKILEAYDENTKKKNTPV